MKNFYEINRALWAKKKIFTLFLISLLGLSQVWGYEASGSAVRQEGGVYYVLYETAESNFSTISEKEYTLRGPGAQVYYQAKCVPILGVYGGDLKLAQYVNGSYGSALFSEQPPKNSYQTYGPVGINYNATKIKLYTEFGATGRKYFQNIKVTMAQYLEDVSATSLSFGSAYVEDANTDKSVTVKWCNVPAMTYNITGTDKDQFEVNVTSNASAGKWGAATFVVSYKHDKAGAHNAKLVIQDTYGEYFQEVTLSGTTAKNANTITWAADEATWKDWGEQLALDATSSNTDVENSPLQYTISNEEYASIENGVLTFLEAGAGKEVTITVTQAEDYKYLGATLTKTFHILRAQTLTWDPMVLNTTIRLNTTRDISAYAVATPAGARAITYSSADASIIAVHEDGVTIEAISLGKAVLTATLAGDSEYKATSISKEFEVKDKENAVLNLGELILNDNDEITIYIGENTGAISSTNTASDVTCQIADESVVVYNAETHQLESRALGTTTLVLSQEANDDYPATELHLTVHVVRYQTVITPSVESAVLFVGDETAVSVNSNRTGEEIAVESSSEAVAIYENGFIKAIGAGSANIIFRQAETDTWSAGEVKVPVTVSRKASSLSVSMNGVARTAITVFQGETVNVSFEKVSDADVIVEQTGGQLFASYHDGVLQASNELGTAYFRAVLPQTNMYEGQVVEFTLTVQKDNRHLPITMSNTLWDNSNFKVATESTTSWDGEYGIVLGDADGGGFNWDDRSVILHFEGIPDKLTFEISTRAIGIGQTLGGATNVEWYIQESATANMPSTKIWTETRADNTFSSTYTVQLQPTTRYIKLCYSGNFAGCFRKLKISELKYVQDPEPASVDFGTALINSGEVTQTVNINWCNIAPMTVESSNPRFTVTPSSFGTYDQLGSQEITISYTHTEEVGSNEADITISNGDETYTKTIHVSAETAKRIQTVTWNADLVATGYAMNVGEQYPDETMDAVAVVQSGERVVFTSLDSEIIEVIADTALLAKKVGTVKIAAYQAGDAEYAEAKDTVLFTVTDLRKQSITWDQNLYGLLTTSEPVELNASATSGMEIVYASSNENVVRVEGNMLIVVGEGEAIITATQAGGVDIDEVEWLPISLNNYVIVRNPASQCNEMSLSVGSLILSSGQLSSTYDLVGTPTNLTFSAMHGTKPNGAWGQKPTYAALLVDQYTKVDGVWGWQNIYNNVVGTENTLVELPLDEGATKVRIRTTETGTEHTISNIRVPRKKFMRADVTEFDEGAEANAIWQKTITVSHSNIDLMTVSTARGLISLDAVTLGEGCGDFGDDAFVASFTPTVKGVEYKDTIIITDGKAQPTTIIIPVRLYSTGLNQYVKDFEFPSSCLTTETVQVPQTSTTANLDVIYLSSDSTIAYVENNQLVILSAGTVDIIAYQAGNDYYNEASLTKTIEIQLTPVEIIEAPTATVLLLGAPLSEAQLIGGSANVEGTFAWQNPELVPAAGINAYTVVFTPTLSNIYATATVDVYVEPTTNPTTYGEYTAHLCEGGEIEFGDETYDYATEEGEPIEVAFYGANQYGGDSIVYLTIIMHEAEYIELYDTLYVGDVLSVEPGVWTVNDQVLNEAEYEMTEATSFDLVQTGQTEFGCDKVITRHITVEAKVETGVENVQGDAVQCTKELRNGILYIRRDGKEYTITGLQVK